MGSRKTGGGVEKVYEAAQRWVDCALRADDSLFTPGEPIWSSHWLGELRKRFLDQPDVGQGSFYDKLETQLEGSPPAVYQLMGEVLYLHFLIIWSGTMRGDTKENRIKQVLEWSEQQVRFPDDLVASLAPGIVSIGQARSKYFPFHVGFVIEFVEQWKQLDPANRRRLLAEPWEFKKFAVGIDLHGSLFREASNAHRVQLEALLHLVHPSTFEGTVSVEQKGEIAQAKAFAHFIVEPTDDVDRKLVQIRRGFEAGLGRGFDFYDSDVRSRWDPSATERWDRSMGRASEFLDTGLPALDGSRFFMDDEVRYKLVIGRKVAAARESVLNGNADWNDLLEEALRPVPGHPLRWNLTRDFNKWCHKRPDDVLKALEAIWTQDDSSVPERIRAFAKLFPRSVISGVGSRMNFISVLLMGLDVESYPPFRVTKFDNAYEYNDYDPRPEDADEAALYEHALGFLDRFTSEARARGIPVRHHLDAQSLLWVIPDLTPKPSDMEQRGEEQFVPLSPEELAEELFLTDPDDFLPEIDILLAEKKQVIFQGPPGTGKTYVAQRLAKHLAGSEERVTLVQLHPSYAYEDFVQGFRPTTLKDGQAGFEMRDGPLLRAAKLARQEPDAKHFLVIDEINRGSLAKVFGELYFLLEYRDEKIRLQYQRDDEEDFSLPKNLYIIGTMNTADRSIALVDLALRRRFYFVEFHPDDEPVKGVLRRWLEANAPDDMEWLAEVVEQVNKLLEDDRHAAIGPSYFMKPGLDDAKVKRIWKHSVLPYIEELRFGRGENAERFGLDGLRRAVASKTPDDGEGEDGEGDASN